MIRLYHQNLAVSRLEWVMRINQCAYSKSHLEPLRFWAAPNYHQLRLNFGALFLSVLSNHPFTRKFFPFNYWQIEFMCDWHKMPPHFEDSIHRKLSKIKSAPLLNVSSFYCLIQLPLELYRTYSIYSKF